MKWTTLVSHSPYEKTTEELLNQRRQRLAYVESNIQKFQYLDAPHRLYGMMELCEEMVDMYDLEKCERGQPHHQSTATASSSGAVTVDSKSRVEEVEEEQQHGEDSMSSDESYCEPNYMRGKEEKKRELFEMALSIDVEADDLWMPDTLSDIYLDRESLKEIETLPNTDDEMDVHATSTLEHEEEATDTRWNYKIFNKFRNKSDDDVRQQWEKDKRRAKPLNVIDTDEALVYEIAEELCDWAKSQELQSPVLTVETISDLFRFKFTDNVVVESMMINVRQLQNVPSKIVKHAPAESTRAELYRQIMWDKLEHDRPDQKNAFLSKVLKKKRVKPDPIREWIETDVIPQELLTTETFFQNLLDSDILEKFVVWLVENPEAYQPKYLRNIGYIDAVKTKYGGVQKIMQEKQNRKNRERFQASKFISREENFLNSIKRMSEIRRLIPPGYRGSTTSL